MTLRHAIPAVLVAALAVGSGLGDQQVSVPASAGFFRASTPNRAGEVPSAPIMPAEAMVRDVAVMRDRTDKGRAGLARLGAQDAALLAEQVAVQVLVKEAALELTPEQWSAFAAVTWHYQTVRQNFEATIAVVSAREKFRLEIPAYPAAGDALREKFYGELRERLGDDTAGAIAGRAGGALEGYFGGFGVSAQTLDFAPSASAAAADYQVTRTARYWNSVDARGTLTLRRETCFPALEDPNGDRWAPYFALLATAGTE